MKKVLNNLEEMRKFATEFAKTLKGGETIGLVGDLGSGKTTFVQALAEALGVEEGVTSPTFVYMHVHGLRGKPFSRLVHADAYRGGFEVMREIGIEEYISDTETVTVIEWADKMKSLLPEGTIFLKFEHLDDDRRKVTVQ